MLESATTPGKELRRRVPTVVVASTPHPVAPPLCQDEGQRAEGGEEGQRAEGGAGRAGEEEEGHGAGREVRQRSGKGARGLRRQGKKGEAGGGGRR
jgi:hypothetical protein